MSRLGSDPRWEARRQCRRDSPELRHALPRLVVGLSLATFGIVYTLGNLGMVDARELLRFWPALLLLFGAANVVAARRGSDVLMGGFWAVVGAGLLLQRLHLLPVRVLDLWPLLLVGFGVVLVLRAVRPRAIVDGSVAVGGAAATSAGADADDDGSRLHALAVMSGVQRRSTSVTFAGGSLTAIMGGIEVDLSAARMSAERVVLDCFAFWGGIEITVPPGWVVRGRVMPLMGGFGAKVQSPPPGEATGELVVTGWAIMGGVVVKQPREQA